LLVVNNPVWMGRAMIAGSHPIIFIAPTQERSSLFRRTAHAFFLGT